MSIVAPPLGTTGATASLTCGRVQLLAFAPEARRVEDADGAAVHPPFALADAGGAHAAQESRATAGEVVLVP